MNLTADPDILAGTLLARLPGLAAILHRHGSRLLPEHVRRLADGLPAPLQPRTDFLDILAELAPDGLGPALASTVADRPVLLTANHHGLDTLCQSWQPTLAFALPDLLEGTPRPVPVLATGLPSMNNVTFPAGLLCSDFSPYADELRTIRLPISPARLRQCMTSAAPAVSLEDLRRTGRAVVEDPRLRPSQRETLLALLEAFGHHLGGRRFVEQAACWNAILWKRLFADGITPPLAFLELEAVTARLLEHDLPAPDSLLAGLLLEDGVRMPLLQALDGVAGCWKLSRLQRLANLAVDGRPGHEDIAGAGTCFFWGVDEKGRQTPLWLERDGSGWRLTGICRSGMRIAWPLAPDALLDGLAQGRLLPSLFTSYAALALARGLACVGGVYQSAYLARMAAGTAAALRQAGETAMADRLTGVTGDWFLAGVHLLFVRRGADLAPAHAVDMIAAGRLHLADLQAMSGLTLEEAIMAGLAETYGELTPREARPAGWRDALCGRTLSAWAPGLSVRELA